MDWNSIGYQFWNEYSIKNVVCDCASGNMAAKGCRCEDLIEAIEGFIPNLLAFLCIFIFILLVYRCWGKSKALYWFMLASLFLFDIIGLGLSVEYFSALNHVCSCSCDDDL